MSEWSSYQFIMMIFALVAAVAALIAIYRHFIQRTSPDTSIAVKKSPSATAAGNNLVIGSDTILDSENNLGKVHINIEESEAAQVGGRNVSKKK